MRKSVDLSSWVKIITHLTIMYTTTIKLQCYIFGRWKFGKWMIWFYYFVTYDLMLLYKIWGYRMLNSRHCETARHRFQNLRRRLNKKFETLRCKITQNKILTPVTNAFNWDLEIRSKISETHVFWRLYNIHSIPLYLEKGKQTIYIRNN